MIRFGSLSTAALVTACFLLVWSYSRTGSPVATCPVCPDAAADVPLPPRTTDRPARSSPRALRVFSWADRVSHGNVSICHVAKGWVANNIHGTLLWGEGPHIPDPAPEARARIEMSIPHPAFFHPTMGKWVHTLSWVARQAPDDVLLFVDAFDALAQVGPEEILRRFEVLAAEGGRERTMVMSAEAWCSPWFVWGAWNATLDSRSKAYDFCASFPTKTWPSDVEREAEDAKRGAGTGYPELPPPLASPKPHKLWQRYLNTGVFAGTRSTLLSFYSMLLYLVPYRHWMGNSRSDPLDDQALASWLVLNASLYGLGVKLDYASRLSYSSHWSHDREMELAGTPEPAAPTRFWRHNITGSVPAIVHLNGFAKDPRRLPRLQAGLWWWSSTFEDVAAAKSAGSPWWRGSVTIVGRNRSRLADMCPNVWEISKGNAPPGAGEAHDPGWFD